MPAAPARSRIKRRTPGLPGGFFALAIGVVAARRGSRIPRQSPRLGDDLGCVHGCDGVGRSSQWPFPDDIDDPPTLAGESKCGGIYCWRRPSADCARAASRQRATRRLPIRPRPAPTSPFRANMRATIKTPDQDVKVGAQVIALGDGKFHGVFYIGGLPGDGWDRGDMQRRSRQRNGRRRRDFHGRRRQRPRSSTAKLTILDPGGDELGTLEQGRAQEPHAGRQAARGSQGAVRRHEHRRLDGAARSSKADLLLAGTRSKDEFQDFTLHLEFRTPFVPKATRPGPRQQRPVFARSLRVPDSRFVRAGRGEQRVRRLLPDQGAGREHVLSAACRGRPTTSTSRPPGSRATKKSRTPASRSSTTA